MNTDETRRVTSSMTPRVLPFASLLTLIAALLLPAEGSGDCAIATLEPSLLNGINAPLVSGSSLLLGLRQEYTRAGRQQRPDFPALSLRRGAQTIPLRLEVLAPMLARYVPARAPQPGQYDVVGLGVMVRFSAPSPDAAVPRPNVRAVQHRVVPESYGATSLALRVVLPSAPPAGAVALIVEGPAGVFGSAALPAGQLEPVIFSDGDCEQRPQGRIDPPPVGSRVRVRYVSERGRLGPPQALRVTQG